MALGLWVGKISEIRRPAQKLGFLWAPCHVQQCAVGSWSHIIIIIIIIIIISLPEISAYRPHGCRSGLQDRSSLVLVSRGW